MLLNKSNSSVVDSYRGAHVALADRNSVTNRDTVPKSGATPVGDERSRVPALNIEIV